MEKSKLSFIKSKLFLKTNKSPIILLFRILFSILFVDFILILLFLMVDFISIEKWTKYIWYFNLEEFIVIIWLMLHLFFFLYLFIFWFVDFYLIKDLKVIHERWILFKKKNIFIIEDINSMEIYQSFLWRIFDYWNIMIFYNEKEFFLKYVPHPKEFVDFIEVLKIED